MKAFFKMIFEIINYMGTAVHSIAKEMPGLAELTITETKALFSDSKPAKITKK